MPTPSILAKLPKYHKDSLELPGYFRPSKRWDFRFALGRLASSRTALSQAL